MNLLRTTQVTFYCALLVCCTSTESAIAPLGFGPLASAERAQREQAPSRTTAKSKRRSGGLDARSAQPVAAAAASTSVGGASSNSDVPELRAGATPEIANAQPDWLGLWRGRDTTRFQIPSFPYEPMVDDNARIRVESGANQEIKLILIDSSNGSDLCSLSAQLQGREAQIAPGQPCFGNEDESMELDVQVRKGKARLENATLILELSLDAEIHSDQLQGGGSIEYRFEGSR